MRLYDRLPAADVPKFVHGVVEGGGDLPVRDQSLSFQQSEDVLEGECGAECSAVLDPWATPCAMLKCATVAYLEPVYPSLSITWRTWVMR
jgi:hypothetical protein